MTTTEQRYYLKGGDTNRPAIEIKTINDNNITISIANPYNEISDTLITENQYNQQMADNQAALDQALLDRALVAEATITKRNSLMASIIPKLVAGTPLTQEESEFLVAGIISL